MQAFLDQTADYLIANYKGRFHKLAIVLPNRRAILYLNKYLSDKLKSPFFSPNCFAIEDFIISLNEYKLADEFYLLFNFYKIYKKIQGNTAKEFENFLSWANILLNDFNIIDLELADAVQIFMALEESKRIEQWNPEGKAATEKQKQYLSFYKGLLSYYLDLQKLYKESKQATRGYIYRDTAENIDKLSLSLKYEKIIFVGLNALSKAEESIIKYFIKENKADILFDADKYYLDDDRQEAGKFIRKYSKTWSLKNFNWKSDCFAGDEAKEINIISVPKQIAQVKYAGELLAAGSTQKTSNTAIVLLNENLLSPLLNSIPSTIDSFNISIGLPLKLIPLADLFKSLFRLHTHSHFSKQAVPVLQFYHKELFSVLNNNYIASLNCFNTHLKHNEFIRKLTVENKSFISKSELITYANELSLEGFASEIGMLFDDWGGKTSAAIDCLSHLLKLLNQTIKSNTQEKEYISEFEKLLRRLDLQLKESGVTISLRSFALIFDRLLSTLRLPFRGEPLKGLQILGLLETRTLDFDNLIILNVNENIIPAAKSHSSFIPYDIKRIFKLPVYRDNDAVYAYHFYRLLQRASKIYLIYNSENDEMGKGEKSRFISQLEYELPLYNPSIAINHKVINLSPLASDRPVKLTVVKTQNIIAKIEKLSKSGFSPSALNTYRNCSLRFYYNYIEGLKEIDEVEETLDAAQLGSLIHNWLYLLFKPLTGKQILAEDIKEMLKTFSNIKEEVIKHSGLEYFDLNRGKNFLIMKLAEKLTGRYLNYEIQKIKTIDTPLFIDSLELILETKLSVNNSIMLLKGRTDRIDFTGNTYRIIDYKTSKIDPKDYNISDPAVLMLSGYKTDYPFQLLLYALMFANQTEPKTDAIEAGVLPLRSISSGMVKVKIDNSENLKGFLPAFASMVENMLVSLCDAQIPFVQTEDKNNCNYCPFISICMRG